MDWCAIIQSLIASVLGSGFIVFVLQKLFEHDLGKKMIKFSWYYEEKAKIITELYARVQKTKYLLGSCTNIIGEYFSQGKTSNRVEMQNKLNSKYDEFLIFFHDTELWFNQKEIFFIKEQKISEHVREILNLIKCFCEVLESLNKESECRALAKQIEDEIRFLSEDLNQSFKNVNEPGK